MNRLRYWLGPVLLTALALVLAGCSKDARAKRALEQGDRYFAQEKYDDAETEYRTAVRLTGLSGRAIGQLGRVYAKEGRAADAGWFLRKAVESEPNNLPVLLAMAEVYEAFHDQTNATKYAVKILSMQPTNGNALVILANDAGTSEANRKQIQKLPGIQQNPMYHTAMAIISMSQQKYSEADAELKLALAADPTSTEVYYVLAELRALQKDDKDAGEAFQNAAAYAPIRSPIRTRFIEFLAKSGNLEQAHKALQEIQDKAPDYVPAMVTGMNLALMERKYEEADKMAQVVLAKDERNYDAMLARGNLCLVRGDPTKAAQLFDHMVTIYPTSAQVHYQTATAYLMAHDKVKAVTALNKALAVDPIYPQANMLLAQLSTRGGDPGTAIVLLTKFLKRSPGTGQAYMLLADAYVAQRKPDAAVAVYRELEKAVPKNPQIPLFRGIVLNVEKRRTEARAAFEKCLEVKPDYTPAVEQLVDMDIRERRYTDATGLIEDQMTKTPTAAEPYELQAKVAFAQTNLADAEKSLLKAIELNPDRSSPYLMLAQVYVTGKNYEPALQKLSALVSRTNEASAHLQIGAIYSQLKDYPKAADAYEKALTANAESIPALNNLAYIDAVYLTKVDRAYELAQKARQLQPFNPSVSDTLGWVLYKRGDYNRALALLEDAAEKMPTDEEIQYHLGMAHYMMDEEDMSRLALQRAASGQQTYANKEEAISTLALLNLDANNSGASALPALEKALKDHPNDPVLMNRIGTVQEQAGEYDKAASTYESALKLNPGAVHIMAKLATLYAMHLNQPDKALSLASDAHKIAPDSAEVNAILGHLAFRNGDHSWGLTLLENAASDLPNRPDLLFDLGRAYYSMGRVADAETTVQKALQSSAKFSESAAAKQFLTLVQAFNDPTRTQAAASLAGEVLRDDQKNVPALMVAGLTQERAGNFKVAKDAYEKALQVYPDFVLAARQLAILDTQHFPDESGVLSLAQKARTAYPNDPYVARTLGILTYRQGQYSRSMDLLNEVVSAGKADGEVYYYLGMDYYKLKRNADSKKALGQALAAKIPDSLASEAKQTMASIK